MDSAFFFRVGDRCSSASWSSRTAIVTRRRARTRKGTDVGRRSAEFFAEFMDWLYWSVTTVMGAGDSSQVHTPIGYASSAGC